MKKVSLWLLLVIWSFALLWAGTRIGRGQVVQRSVSPDGQRIAEVRQRWTFDPPAHSLWLKRGGRERPMLLTDLPEDQDWCDEILWSPDSSKVAFLVRGVRLLVFDTATGSVLKNLNLVLEDGYPGSLEARSVSFSGDGRRIVFSPCERASNRCTPGKRVNIF